MRDLTIVGLKLLGVLGASWTLNLVPQIGLGVSMVYSQSATGISSAGYLLSMVAYFVVSAVLAFLLITRTDWIATKVGFSEAGSHDALPPHPAQLLRVGLLLVGAYVFVEAAPELVQVLIEASQFSDWRGPHGWARIIGAATKLILSLTVILRSRSLAVAALRDPQ